MKVDQISGASDLTGSHLLFQRDSLHPYTLAEYEPYIDYPSAHVRSNERQVMDLILHRTASFEKLYYKHITLARKHQTAITTLISVLFCIGLLSVCIVISWLLAFDITWLMVLGTALWAAKDSSKIELNRYKSGISCEPIVLFFACALLWIVGFPWYLAMRCKIKAGRAVLNSEVADVANSGA